MRKSKKPLDFRATKRTYLHPTTGTPISRRQYEKLRHGGMTIEQRAKERRAAGIPLRKQAPRKGVLARVASAVQAIFLNIKAKVGGIAKKYGVSLTTVRKHAGPEGLRIIKRRGAYRYLPPKPKLIVYARDNIGSLVSVFVDIDEAVRIGRFKLDAHAGKWAELRRRYGKHFEFEGADGNKYYISNSENEWKALLHDIKETHGHDDIVDDHFYKEGQLRKVA